MKKKLNADSPSFTPFSSTAKASQSATATVSPTNSPNVSAAAFVPRAVKSAGAPAFNGKSHFDPGKIFVPDKTPFVPEQSIAHSDAGVYNMGMPSDNQMYTTGSAEPEPISINPYAQKSVPPEGLDFDNLSVSNAADPSIPFPHASQTSIYQHHSAYPLNYHLYAPTPLGMDKGLLSPHQRMVEDFFISNDLREELQRKNEATLQAIPGLSLPEFVHVYHSLVPLDTSSEKSTKIFGYPSWAYKCESNLDGKIYCMRRIEGYRLTNEKTMKLLKLWGKVSSPAVVALQEAFTTKAFGDNSLVFIYDYYPLSVTLQSAYLSPYGLYQQGGHRLAEDIIWGYATQLISAMRIIHGCGLAARTIDPSRIIMTKKGRVRINCVGVLDFLNFESDELMSELQKKDLTDTSKLLLSLATIVPASASRNKYSEELTNLIADLNQEDKETSLDTIIARYAPHFLDSFDSALFENDNLESELLKELENGRLVRLMVKLGFVNERPEQDLEKEASNTGDRYLLKLFRDYVFHQVDEKGNPVLDLNHVLICLNKLDAGIDEMILLVTRDEQNSVIVSYKELKTLLEGSFRTLVRSSR